MKTINTLSRLIGRNDRKQRSVTAERPNVSRKDKVPNLSRNESRLQTILVPTDFSEFSMIALRRAMVMAKRDRAKVILLHVVEPQLYPENILIPPEMEEVNMKRMRDCKDRLGEITKMELKPSLAGNPIVRIGTPYVEIVDAARLLKADLIVIATHGWTGLKHAFLGSTAERVVRHALCPVLTMRGQKTIKESYSAPITQFPQ